MTTAKTVLLVLVGLYSTFVPGNLVSAQNQETCSGLEQLARNSNSNLLRNCARDAECTKVTCQAAGLLSSYIGSVIFTLRPCEMTPGIKMGIFESSGTAIVDQLVTSPTTINHNLGFASASIYVFVNRTASSIGISVDPITVNAGFFGTISGYLITFTSIYLDQTECHSSTVTTVTTETGPTADQDSPNIETCRGLEQLSANTNPNLLSNCVRDRDCTEVTCQGSGILSGQVDSATITLSPCQVPPGFIVELAKDGNALVSQLVTAPVRISHNAGIATLEVNLFVNSSSNAIGILIDPFTVTTILGTSAQYLVNFTSILLDKSGCAVTTVGDAVITTVRITENQGGHVATEADLVTSTTTPVLTDGTEASQNPTESDSPNIETCRGLEQLSTNTNPNLLSNCIRDSDCTEVTCQGSGLLSGQVDSATITLSPCQVPPGVIVELAKDGSALVSQLVTAPVRISHNAGIATVEVNLFVNSSSNAIGILIDPFTITTILGTSAQYLVSFTSIQLDKSGCAVTTVGDAVITTVRITENQGGHVATEADMVTSTTTPVLTESDGTEASQNPTESVTTFETCAGLEQLATNTNPNLLENCARDNDCSQVTCQAAGLISSQLDSLTIMLELCETPPGITIQILKDGSAIINQLVTTPTTITKTVSVATVEAYVFVNSTASTIGISVDPVSISAGTLGSASDILVSFTQVPFNRSPCNTVMSTTSELLKSTTAESSKIKGTGWIPKLSFQLFLLPLITLFTGITV